MTPSSPEKGHGASIFNQCDALVEILISLDIRAVFGVSGANIEDFHDAIHRRSDRIRSVFSKTEMGAAFMADGAARTGASFGVCCSTSGGGMMNLAVGVAEAFQDGVPLLAVVGLPPSQTDGRGGFQDGSGLGQTVNAESLWNSISKRVHKLGPEDHLPTVMENLLTTMLEARRGPVVLLLPKDVQQLPFAGRGDEIPDVKESRSEGLAASTPSRNPFEPLRTALENARRPVLIAGGDEWNEWDRDAVRKIAAMLQIPVTTTIRDLNAHPHDDPLFMGVIGAAGQPSAHRYLREEADLLLVFGMQWEVMCSGPLYAAPLGDRMIFIGTTPEHSRRGPSEALWIHASPWDLYEELLVSSSSWPLFEGIPEHYALVRYAPMVPGTVSPPVNALTVSRITAVLDSLLQDAETVLFDAGNFSAGALHYFTPHCKTRTILATGMGGMGYAVSAAVGAQMQHPDAFTVVICGDGAFMMTGTDIHTAIAESLPILYVVLNNQGHGMCATRQDLYFEARHECSHYAPFSVAGMCSGMGGLDSVWVESASDVVSMEYAIEKLTRSWDRKGPAVLELLTHWEELPPFAAFRSRAQELCMPLSPVPPLRRHMGNTHHSTNRRKHDSHYIAP